MENLLFLDTETTGKLEDGGRLIQLCYKLPVRPEGMSWGCNSIFKAPVPISFEAMAVHHITQKQVDQSEEFAGSFANQELKKFIKNGGIVIAHNAPFDIEILNREGVKVGKFIDTLKCAQFLWDEPSYKLQYLRYRFDLDVNAKAHDAEGDVDVLISLFNFMYEGFAQNSKSSEDAIDQMVKISEKPVLLRRMPFGKYSGKSFEEISKIDKGYLQWLAKQPEMDENVKYTVKQSLPKKESETELQQGLY